MQAHIASTMQAVHVRADAVENTALLRAPGHASYPNALKSGRSVSRGASGAARLEDLDPTTAGCENPGRCDRHRSPSERHRHRSRSRGRNRNAARKAEASSVENLYPGRAPDTKSAFVQKPSQPLREINSLASRPLHDRADSAAATTASSANGSIFSYYGPCDAGVAPATSGAAGRDAHGDRHRRRSRSRGRSRGRSRDNRRQQQPQQQHTGPTDASCSGPGIVMLPGVAPPRVLERFGLPPAPVSDPSPTPDGPVKVAAIVDEVTALLSNLRLGSATESSTSALPENCLSLDEYRAAAERGELVYKGKGTVEEKYSDGWVFNISTRRWVRVVKSAELAASAKVEERMSELQSQLADVFDLLKRRKEEEEAKAKEIEALAKSQAPTSIPTRLDLACVVVDTNVLLDDLDLVNRWLDVVQRSGSPVKILVPRAVMLELDGLNHHKQLPPERAHKVRTAVRFMSQFPGLIQADNEVFRDHLHHAEPHRLRGDDAILNCCLYFSQTLGARVTLVTRDKLFRVRATNNGISVQDPFYLNVHEL